MHSKHLLLPTHTDKSLGYKQSLNRIVYYVYLLFVYQGKKIGEIFIDISILRFMFTHQKYLPVFKPKLSSSRKKCIS